MGQHAGRAVAKNSVWIGVDCLPFQQMIDAYKKLCLSQKKLNQLNLTCQLNAGRAWQRNSTNQAFATIMPFRKELNFVTKERLNRNVLFTIENKRSAPDNHPH